jgi:adenosylcobinamide kinase/adenosylcobinamide-phosphate guanylyltransferase
VAERLVVINGGARSGKSRFGLVRARQLGTRRCFMATAVAFDDEMRQRIARHQAERGVDFETREAGLDLARELREARLFDVVLIDCLTLFLSRLLLEHEQLTELARERVIEDSLGAALAAIEDHPGSIVVVTNEVGMGVVPGSSLGRCFRDVQGRANQLLAARADEVYVATMGFALRLHPAPLTSTPIVGAPSVAEGET